MPRRRPIQSEGRMIATIIDFAEKVREREAERIASGSFFWPIVMFAIATSYALMAAALFYFLPTLMGSPLVRLPS
jgi:hypothetical protein